MKTLQNWSACISLIINGNGQQTPDGLSRSRNQVWVEKKKKIKMVSILGNFVSVTSCLH